MAVSADDRRSARAMAEHVRGTFTIVSDRRLLLVRRLGLVDHDPYKRHPISRPAAFGVGHNGCIIYRYLGRSEADRPQAALLVLAAQRLAARND